MQEGKRKRERELFFLAPENFSPRPWLGTWGGGGRDSQAVVIRLVPPPFSMCSIRKRRGRRMKSRTRTAMMMMMMMVMQ